MESPSIGAADMAQTITRSLRAPLGAIWPLVALGVGVAGLIGSAQAAGELLYILECAGAVGGGPRPRAGRAREV